MAETETDEVNTARSFTTYQVTPPSKFSFKSSEWTRWIRRFERFRIATELLMGRKIKSTIPIIPRHLIPKLPNQELFKEKEEVYRSKQKKNFDNRHKAQQLKHLPSGATVYITDMDCTGTIIRPSKKPRSYLVDTPTTVVRRNRVQLRNIPIDTNEKQDEQQTVPSLNISSRPRRIKTLSLKARENLGLE